MTTNHRLDRFIAIAMAVVAVVVVVGAASGVEVRVATEADAWIGWVMGGLAIETLLATVLIVRLALRGARPGPSRVVLGSAIAIGMVVAFLFVTVLIAAADSADRNATHSCDCQTNVFSVYLLGGLAVGAVLLAVLAIAVVVTAIQGARLRSR